MQTPILSRSLSTMAQLTNEQFLQPLADKIAEFVIECYKGKAFGPLSPIARKDGEDLRAKALQIEEASLLLLACNYAARKALQSYFQDPQSAMASSIVLARMVNDRIKNITNEIDETGVEHAFFGGDFPNGVFYSEVARSRLPESEMLSITVPILIDWSRFMSNQFGPVASAALKISAGRSGSATERAPGSVQELVDSSAARSNVPRNQFILFLTGIAILISAFMTNESSPRLGAGLWMLGFFVLWLWVKAVRASGG